MGLGHTTFAASPLHNNFSTFANIANNAKLFIRGIELFVTIGLFGTTRQTFLFEIFPSMATFCGTT